MRLRQSFRHLVADSVEEQWEDVAQKKKSLSFGGLTNGRIIIHKHLPGMLGKLLSNDVIVKVGIGPARNPFSNIITSN